MVVQHNMQAVNANRMLNVTTSGQAKSTEKLSSGFKINRAADDAAGLAISEKMRKQIKGLDRASTNAQDGVSAVQTAEGALNEVHSMLQRMNELAVQSANGTNSESDRTAIQNEIDQLTTEIDRVSETTKFNETYLLKGDKDATKKASWSYDVNHSNTAATASMNTDTATGLTGAVEFNENAHQDDQNAIAKALRDSGIRVTQNKTYVENGANSGDITTGYTLELTGDAAQKYDVVTSDAVAGEFSIQDHNGNKIATITVSGGAATEPTANEKNTISSAVITANYVTAGKVGTESAQYYDKDGNKISANSLNKYFSMDDGATNNSWSKRADAPLVYDAVGNQTTLNTADVAAVREITGDLQLRLHVGADATENNKITLNIASMSAKGLGINGLKIDGANDNNANDAIETIKTALQKVSDQRAALGAVQNRLEHTIANLDNVVENTEASESRIRDTDIAEEMVTYSKNNILAQAGQSMLAQANQSTQGALSLLG
jgi:flagellin